MRLIVLSLILLSSFSWATTYFIQSVDVSDPSDKNSANVVKELITSAIYENGHDLSMTKDSSALELKAKVLKLSTHYLITLTEFNSEGLVTNSKKAKINTIDKLDVAVDALCTAIFQESKPPKETIEVHSNLTKNKKNITSDRNRPDEEREKTIVESAAQKKLKALNFQTIGFGPAWLENFDNDNMAYTFLYGRYFEVHPNASIKAQVQLNTNYTDKLAMFLSGSIGLNYYFTQSNISPYIGADFGYAIASFDTTDLDAKAGFAYGLSIGTLLFRSSDVQLGVDLNHKILIPKINDKNAMSTALALTLHF